MPDRTILHIDINSCFANIECLYRPEIRERPVAVGGNEEARHGIILAKNEHAKKFGIKTGEAIWQARQKCPKLLVLQPNYDRYMRFSRLARQLYGEYSDFVEPFGLDEAWVDVTGTQKLCGGAPALADEIRRRVKDELGITVSVGVSNNKIFAKLGSDYKKPDAVTVFAKDDMRERVWPLPAGDLLYVGPATKRKLERLGIRTIGEIAQAPVSHLQSWFGKWGLVLSSFANGQDLSPVARTGTQTVIKSIGNSTTTPRDLAGEDDAKAIFYMLCESVAERMRENGFMAQTVQIWLRDNELYGFERQIKLETPTCLASELCAAAMGLLKANYRWDRPLRSIGVRASGLVPERTPVQTSLFLDAAKRQRLEELERTVDDIRRRFGHYAIGRAVTTADTTLRNISPRDEHVNHPVGYFKAK